MFGDSQLQIAENVVLHQQQITALMISMNPTLYDFYFRRIEKDDVKKLLATIRTAFEPSDKATETLTLKKQIKMKFKALSTTFFSLKKGNQVEVVVEDAEREAADDEEKNLRPRSPPQVLDKDEELRSVQNDFMRIIDQQQSSRNQFYSKKDEPEQDYDTSHFVKNFSTPSSKKEVQAEE
jgi:hypothetical protein